MFMLPVIRSLNRGSSNEECNKHGESIYYPNRVAEGIEDNSKIMLLISQ